jgi:hypothetical protein
VYHLQLRMRPHMARAFNLTAAELTDRFLAPMVNGRELIYNDREWSPRKTTVTIYEGPELPVEQMGMGRGWGNVQRSGTDVTERILRQARGQTARHPALDRLQERLAGRLSASPVTLGEVLALADDLMDASRVSERLAVAELAVWELLARGEGSLLADGVAVEPERRQEVLMRSESWLGGAVCIERRA